jgi:hypothetical protein
MLSEKKLQWNIIEMKKWLNQADEDLQMKTEERANLLLLSEKKINLEN